MTTNLWNRKTKTLLALSVAAMMLLAVVFAGTSATPGYDAFKEMIRTQAADRGSEHPFKEGAFDFNVALWDKDQVLFSVAGSGQGDANEKAFGATLKLQAAGLDKDLQLYGTQETFMVLDIADQSVYVGSPKDMDNEAYRDHEDLDDFDRAFDPKSEALLDYFVGDMKHGFKIVNGSDGSEDITLKLSASEIPAIVNLLASMKGDDTNHGSRYHAGREADFDATALKGYPLFDALSSLEDLAPELESNVVVQGLEVVFDRNLANELVGMAFTVEVSGLDADQQPHLLKVQASVTERAKANGLEAISLEGKTVYTLPQK